MTRELEVEPWQLEAVVRIATSLRYLAQARNGNHYTGPKLGEDQFQLGYVELGEEQPFTPIGEPFLPEKFAIELLPGMLEQVRDIVTPPDPKDIIAGNHKVNGKPISGDAAVK